MCSTKFCIPKTRGCIQKFTDWVDKEIYAYLWYCSLRSNTKVYGGKIHYTDSQNSDTTAPSGRELYRLQFSSQAVSPVTSGYTLVWWKSHDSSVGIALGYGLDDRDSRFDSLRGLGIFPFTTSSRTTLGPTQPPIQGELGALSLGVKQLGA
jgi:hypothetical protein